MKKIKRLILHIGTIKTGTTSIQESLGQSRNTLLEHGIYYPAIRPYNHIFTFNPIFIRDPMEIEWFRRRLKPSENKETKIQGYTRDWLKEFETCSKDKDFIISSEHLSAGLFTEDAVRRLKEFVEPYFEQIAVIAYIRHYNTWIPSEVQQSVKNGFSAPHGLKEMVQRLQNCPPLMSYRESLQKWVNVFGRETIVVRPFDPRLFYNNSLLADFFNACGLPADDIPIPEIRVNESVSAHAVAFLQKYNHKYPLYVNGSVNLNRGLIRDNIPFPMYHISGYEKFKLDLIYTAQQAETINKEIDYVNQFFSNGYQFQHVSPQVGETQVPSAEDIPVEFFVDLINNYNKRIEAQRRKIENLQRQSRAYQDSSVRFERILNALKIPFFLRVINKLPWLKKTLKKAITYLAPKSPFESTVG